MSKKLNLNYRNIPNWGDQLNVYLAKNYFFKEYAVKSYHNQFPSESTRKKLSKLLPANFVFQTNIQLIGSVIGFCNPATIVLGAGLISDKVGRYLPKKVMAVRGPLTATLLREKGLEVPDIYCDPGIFISDVYHPKATKKFRFGIIPHYSEFEQVNKMFEGNPDVLVISVREDIEPFCDLVLACEQIVSSSLHGLIVADSYDIPSSWVSFGVELLGDDFKFKDYFLSTPEQHVPERSTITQESDFSNLVFRKPVSPQKTTFLEQVKCFKTMHL